MHLLPIWKSARYTPSQQWTASGGSSGNDFRVSQGFLSTGLICSCSLTSCTSKNGFFTKVYCITAIDFS